MRSEEQQARLEAIIEPIVTAMGFALVRVQLAGAAGGLTLQVMAEDPATGQLTLDQCAAISRALDLPLDEADPIPEEYALEVSSPGIDRPLTRLADWDRWTGHEIKARLEPKVDGRARIVGSIVGRDGDTVTVDVKGHGPLALPLSHVQGAKLVLTDRLIAATRPLDATGADEIIETPSESEPVNDNDTIED